MIDAIGSAPKFPLLVAIGVVVVMGLQGVNAYRTLTEKASAQEAVTESVQRWKQSYMAVADSVKHWEANYRRDDTVQDLVSLFSIIDLGAYGLRADTDKLILNKVDPVAQNGMHIGLTKVCLATAGGVESAGLDVQADNYTALFAGLKRLAQRPDIYINTITVKGDKAVPLASLGDFCVLLRRGI